MLAIARRNAILELLRKQQSVNVTELAAALGVATETIRRDFKEMEAAGQFVVGRLHGMRMGAVMSVIANRTLDRWGDNGGEEKACRAASEAMRILSEWDGSGRVGLNARVK